MRNKILSSKVEVDNFTVEVSKAFDYTFNGKVSFEVPSLPELPKDFGVGLIVGASGSGKTSIIKEYFNKGKKPKWDRKKAVISHFATPEEGINRLSSVGLNTIPSWVKPFHVLSNGEKFRAMLARTINSNVAIDEFTSVVDRTVAKSTSVAIRKFIDKQGFKNVVFASCHRDIIEWLEPDWVYDTDSRELLVGRFLRQRPKLVVEIYPCKRDIWKMFSPYHYLSGNLNPTARTWVAVLEGRPIGFASSLPLPSGTLKNAYRGHRTVVLPDFQGLGIGVRLSDCIAELHKREGKRYFSRTAHVRMGHYRDTCGRWKPTSKYKRLRTDARSSQNTNYNNWVIDAKRVCYSHEYIGGDLPFVEFVNEEMEVSK